MAVEEERSRKSPSNVDSDDESRLRLLECSLAVDDNELVRLRVPDVMEQWGETKWLAGMEQGLCRGDDTEELANCK